MRYRLMASYLGASYQAAVGPSDRDVTLFAAPPPPEEHGFSPVPGGGIWRKQVRLNELDGLWESRPIGSYHGEPCLVLDDLGDRLHIVYLGMDERRAGQLGYWQVDRGVFEVVVPRQDVTDLAEERHEFPIALLLSTLPRALDAGDPGNGMLPGNGQGPGSGQLPGSGQGPGNGIAWNGQAAPAGQRPLSAQGMQQPGTGQPQRQAGAYQVTPAFSQAGGPAGTAGPAGATVAGLQEPGAGAPQLPGPPQGFGVPQGSGASMTPQPQGSLGAPQLQGPSAQVPGAAQGLPTGPQPLAGPQGFVPQPGMAQQAAAQQAAAQQAAAQQAAAQQAAAQQAAAQQAAAQQAAAQQYPVAAQPVLSPQGAVATHGMAGTLAPDAPAAAGSPQAMAVSQLPNAQPPAAVAAWHGSPAPDGNGQWYYQPAADPQLASNGVSAASFVSQEPGGTGQTAQLNGLTGAPQFAQQQPAQPQPAPGGPFAQQAPGGVTAYQQAPSYQPSLQQPGAGQAAQFAPQAQNAQAAPAQSPQLAQPAPAVPQAPVADLGAGGFTQPNLVAAPTQGPPLATPSAAAPPAEGSFTAGSALTAPAMAAPTVSPPATTGLPPATQAPLPSTPAPASATGQPDPGGSSRSGNPTAGTLSKLTGAVRGRRAARKPRRAMSAIFADLIDMADIPRDTYAVDEEVTGAMCLFKTDGGYEVFSCAEDARHEVRFFEDEEAAYFYLFGVLAAEALRNGRLNPRRT